MTTPPADDRDRPHPDWTRPPEPPLHRAARIGDLAALERLLADGADINERADLEHDNGPHLNDLTTLMVAARSIDGATVATLRWLIEHGADLHATSAGGNTAAWYAAGHGGRWAFHAKAVTPDHVERLAFLLDLGLDPCECNFIGRSLLTEACEAGDPARVRLLLARGAIAAPKPAAESTPSILERMQALIGSIPLPGRRRVPTGSHSSHELPIFCAARSGCAVCTQLILDAGADVDTRDSSGNTPLMVSGSADVVRTLLAAGATRDAVNEFGDDAFATRLSGDCESSGCEAARPAVIHALLDAGADLERTDAHGADRLAAAAFAVDAEAVTMLLDLGARVDARNRSGETALHAVCWQGGSKDADTTAAIERIIRTLVAAGLPVDVADEDGCTPMHQAASGDWGNPAAIRTLLELGAAPDPADTSGVTPLLLAAGEGEIACIELLLTAGADPEARAADGTSVIDAAKAHLTSWEEIVTDGPDEEMVAFSRSVHEDVARALGQAEDDDPPFDAAAALEEQTARHEDVLRTARAALAILEAAVNGDRPSPDAGARHGSADRPD